VADSCEHGDEPSGSGNVPKLMCMGTSRRKLVSLSEIASSHDDTGCGLVGAYERYVSRAETLVTAHMTT